MAPRVPNGFPLDSITETGDRVKTAINPSVIGGNQAITTQSFSELNSKYGTQWQYSFYNPSLAGTGNADVIIVTGAEHVIIKGVVSFFKCEGIQSTLYKDPVYTGGASQAYYNLRDDFNYIDDGIMRIYGGATVTDAGSQVGPVITALGEATGNPSPGINFAVIGDSERILLPNSTYLYRIHNIDSGATPLTGVTSFYEGPLSTDQPSEG